jgi:hypothetical protein
VYLGSAAHTQSPPGLVIDGDRFIVHGAMLAQLAR